MNHKLLFTVKDQKAETFSVPFGSDNKATALREFATLVQDTRTLIGMHPEDFDLFAIGSFNLFSGQIELFPSVEHVANGADLKPKSES